MLEDSVSSTPTFWGSLISWFTPTVFFLLLQLVIGTIFIISNLANANTNTTHKQHDPQGHDFQHPQQHQIARSPSMLQRLKSINFYSYTYRSQDPQNTHFHNTPEFQTHEREHPQFVRSPSVLQRLKSINLYSYFPTEPFSSKLTTDHNTNVSYETHVPQKSHEREPVVETDEEKEEDDDYVVPDNIINNNNNENYNYNLEENEEESSSLDEIYSQLQGQEGHFTRTQSDTKPTSGEVPVKLPRKMKKSASSKSAFSHFKEEDIVESRRPATVKEAKVSGGADEDDEEVDAKADDFINKFKQQLKLQRLDSIMRYKEMIGRGAGQ